MIIKSDKLLSSQQALYFKRIVFKNNILVTTEYEKNFGRYYSRRNDEVSLRCNDLIIERVQKNFSRKIFFAYGFLMYYTKSDDGSIGYLNPHLDNLDNEITVSLCVDKFPTASHPLMVSKRVFANPYPHRLSFKEYLDDFVTVNLEVGDGCIFNGRNRVHWRGEKETESPFLNVLLHYMYEPYSSEDVNELLSKNPVLYFNNVDEAIAQHIIS